MTVKENPDVVTTNREKTTIQRAFESIPDTLKRRLYRSHLRLSPNRTTITVSRSPFGWEVRNRATGDSYVFPARPNIGQLDKVSAGYADRMRNKYLPTKVVGDRTGIQTVVDVGAFVGAFSKTAASLADTVLAIEPSPATLRCLRTNVAGDSITTVEGAVGETDGETSLSLGEDPSDNSRLSVDDRATGEQVETPMFRLDTIAEKYGLSQIDVLKVDAEGAEPEALSGLERVTPRVVTVDTTPERNGESTRGRVSRRLARCGYQVVHYGDVTIGIHQEERAVAGTRNHWEADR